MRLARRAAAVAIGGGALFAGSADAANFVVTTTADAAPNACDASCTLRDAVEAADGNGVGADTITFATGVTGEIRLTQGQLEMDSPMTVTGPGADVLAISGDANNDDDANAGDSRIAVTFAPTTISGLTMIEGFAAGSGPGGAIFALDDLTLDRMSFSDNLALSGGYGGAVSNVSGDLIITRSSFSDNRSGIANGGAVSVGGPEYSSGPTSTLSISGSTFTGNWARRRGGAIYVGRDTSEALIATSTITGNTVVDEGGGGIHLQGPYEEPGVIRGSTITGNTAAVGGGITVRDLYAVGDRIESSTIAGNTATYSGGGIYLLGFNYAGIEMSNVIVADNSASAGGDDLARRVDDSTPAAGDFKLSHSLVESPGSAPIVEAPAGSNLFGVDPALGPLASNGGPTQTMLPGPTSPAIDAGIANGLTTDQRGFARTADAGVANASGSDGTDVGAVELRVAAASVDSGPSGATKESSPSFDFSAPGAASVECRIDDGPYLLCTSPFAAPFLVDGPHAFQARAISVDGVAGPVASRSFEIDTSLTGAKVSGRGTQRQKGGIKVEVSLGAGESAEATISGRVKVGKKKFTLKGASSSLAPDKQTKLTLKLKGSKASRAVLKALDDGKKVVATVDVEFTDGLGNSASKSASFKLK